MPDHYENKEAIEKYARANKLWHAHLGDPVFKDTFHGKYKVSDWDSFPAADTEPYKAFRAWIP
nr:hypothetical protein [Klebsiella pneumoniae subsp. pneumoniae]